MMNIHQRSFLFLYSRFSSYQSRSATTLITNSKQENIIFIMLPITNKYYQKERITTFQKTAYSNKKSELENKSLQKMHKYTKTEIKIK